MSFGLIHLKLNWEKRLVAVVAVVVAAIVVAAAVVVATVEVSHVARAAAVSSDVPKTVACVETSVASVGSSVAASV